MKEFRKSETWRQIRPWIILVTYAVILGVVVFQFDDVSRAVFSFFALFKSLFYAIGIAFILNLPMKKLERFFKKHLKEDSFLYKRVRGISIFFTLILAFIVIVIVGSLILPSIIDSLITLFQNLPNLFNGVVQSIDEVLAYLHIDFQVHDIASVERFLDMSWSDVISTSVSFLSNSVSGIMDNALSFTATFATWFTAFMFSLYLLASKEMFIIQIKKLVAVLLPKKQAQFILDCGTKANRIFSSFVGGQLIECCILWILYYVTMRLFQFPYPELIATLIAVMAVVPVLGPMLAMVVGAVMILSKDALAAIAFIIYYQILSQIEDNFIYPKVVGNSVGLPGLWVLLSIFVFGDLYGFIGMLIAVPTTAFFYVLIKEFVNGRLEKRKIVVALDGVSYEDEMIINDEAEEILAFDPMQFSEEQKERTED